MLLEIGDWLRLCYPRIFFLVRRGQYFLVNNSAVFKKHQYFSNDRSANIMSILFNIRAFQFQKFVVRKNYKYLFTLFFSVIMCPIYSYQLVITSL